MWNIAGGIIIGGLVLAFLLRTRAGWYVMVGVVGAMVIGGLWSLLVFSVVSKDRPSSETQNWFYLLSVPIVALAAGAWTPRFIRIYQQNTKDTAASWAAVKHAADSAGEEVLMGAVVVAYVGSLLGGPFVWAYSPEPVAGWAKVATLISWGIAILFVGAWLFARFRDRNGATTN